jgi:hypothetical protein
MEGGDKAHAKFCLENTKERDHLRDLGVEGKIILKWILGKYYVSKWSKFYWLNVRPNGVSF